MSRRTYNPVTSQSQGERMKAVIAQLEAGVSDVFQSGQYKNYLGTMSKLRGGG